jgi:hypothetical protein
MDTAHRRCHVKLTEENAIISKKETGRPVRNNASCFQAIAIQQVDGEISETCNLVRSTRTTNRLI